MKRLWIGIVLMLLLLESGLFSAISIANIQKPVSADLQAASRACLQGNWEDANLFASQAQQRWQKYRHAAAALADHSPMEDVDCLFAELEVYLHAKEALPFASCCAALAVSTRAIAEAHALNWWNLL